MQEFEKISDWIYEQSGITIPVEKINFEEYMNPRDILSVQGTVPFIGPMNRRGSIPTIKLDLTNDEIIINKSELRNVHHPYSDTKLMQINAYCIEEIFAEKLRTLVERLRPRDLYDVIHLHQDPRWQPNKKIVRETLQKKCEYKKVDVPTMELLESSPNKQGIGNDWDDMLSHQIADLEPFDYYWEALPDVFKWLNKA